VHCTKISAELKFGVTFPECAPPKNVALVYDVGKISTFCLVTCFCCLLWYCWMLIFVELSNKYATAGGPKCHRTHLLLTLNDLSTSHICGQLHWLPIRQHIDFKMAIMVYKALNG